MDFFIHYFLTDIPLENVSYKETFISFFDFFQQDNPNSRKYETILSFTSSITINKARW